MPCRGATRGIDCLIAVAHALHHAPPLPTHTHTCVPRGSRARAYVCVVWFGGACLPTALALSRRARSQSVFVDVCAGACVRAHVCLGWGRGLVCACLRVSGRRLQGAVLDGHSLQLKVSTKTLEGKERVLRSWWGFIPCPRVVLC